MHAYGDIARLLLPLLDPPSRHALGLSCRNWWRVYIETCGHPRGPLLVVNREGERVMVTGESHAYGVYPRRVAVVYGLQRKSLLHRELSRCEMTADGYALVYGKGGINDVTFKASPVENIFRRPEDPPHYRYELTKIAPPPWTWGLPVHPDIPAEILDDLVDSYRWGQIHPYLLRELCALMQVDDRRLGRKYDDWRPVPAKRRRVHDEPVDQVGTLISQTIVMMGKRRR